MALPLLNVPVVVVVGCVLWVSSACESDGSPYAGDRSTAMPRGVRYRPQTHGLIPPLASPPLPHTRHYGRPRQPVEEPRGLPTFVERTPLPQPFHLRAASSSSASVTSNSRHTQVSPRPFTTTHVHVHTTQAKAWRALVARRFWQWGRGWSGPCWPCRGLAQVRDGWEGREGGRGGWGVAWGEA